jgi:hypothetical protein
VFICILTLFNNNILNLGGLLRPSLGIIMLDFTLPPPASVLPIEPPAHQIIDIQMEIGNGSMSGTAPPGSR